MVHQIFISKCVPPEFSILQDHHYLCLYTHWAEKETISQHLWPKWTETNSQIQKKLSRNLVRMEYLLVFLPIQNILTVSDGTERN